MNTYDDGAPLRETIMIYDLVARGHAPEDAQRMARAECERLDQIDAVERDILAALADCSDARRTNLIRRARAWLAAESGGLEKADLGQLLRVDNLPIWQLPPDQAAALLYRIEAGP